MVMDKNAINLDAWNHFDKTYYENSIISKDDFHYGLCIGGDRHYHILPNLTGLNACDIGTGTGENAFYLALRCKSVVGIDPSSFFISIAKKQFVKNNLYFEQNDFFSYQGQGVRYDLISFIGSFDYIELSDLFFQKLNNISFIGTKIIIAKMHPIWTTLFNHELDEPNLHSYFLCRNEIISYGQDSFWRWHYSMSDIIQNFKSNGWNLSLMLEPSTVKKKECPFYMKNAFEDPLLQSRMEKIPMTLILGFNRER